MLEASDCETRPLLVRKSCVRCRQHPVISQLPIIGMRPRCFQELVQGLLSRNPDRGRLLEGGRKCMDPALRRRYAREITRRAMPDNACSLVAGMGNLACLRYLRDNGCRWDALTLACAARGGQKDCLEFAHENGCPGLAEVAGDAFESGDNDCMRYILDTLCKESSPYFWHRFMERKRRFNPLLLSLPVTGTILNIQRRDNDRKKIDVLDWCDEIQPAHEKDVLPLSESFNTRSIKVSLEIRDCSMFPGRSFSCDTTDHMEF